MAADTFEQQVTWWYGAGYWTLAMVAAAVAKGRLSKAAFRRITGRAYEG